ncbi:hypothetical protein [Halobacillus campisalis]
MKTEIRKDYRKAVTHMKFLDARGQCNREEVSMCSSVVIYEDQNGQQYFEIRYAEYIQQKVFERFAIEEDDVVSILALAYLIKYPEYKYRKKILIKEEELMLVFEDLNMPAIYDLYHKIENAEEVEVDSFRHYHLI